MAFMPNNTTPNLTHKIIFFLIPIRMEINDNTYNIDITKKIYLSIFNFLSCPSEGHLIKKTAKHKLNCLFEIILLTLNYRYDNIIV